jgi:hypothetical protein
LKTLVLNPDFQHRLGQISPQILIHKYRAWKRGPVKAEGGVNSQVVGNSKGMRERQSQTEKYKYERKEVTKKDDRFRKETLLCDNLSGVIWDYLTAVISFPVEDVESTFSFL